MSSGAFGRTVAALLLLALAACSGIEAAPKPPTVNFEASLAGLATAYDPVQVLKCINTPLSGQQPCRDTIVQAAMIAIDLRYEEFEIGFFDANRYAGFGGTLAVLGLTTAGAVVSGGTSQLLSAAAAGVTGAKEAFKREVLAEQTSIALLTAMRTQRDQVGLRIRLGLRRNATEYPLGVALADVSAYYRAGTIVGALTGVTQAVGVEREQAQENLQQSIVDPDFVPPVRVLGVGPAPAPASTPPPPPRDPGSNATGPIPPLGGGTVRPLPPDLGRGSPGMRPSPPTIRPGIMVPPGQAAGITQEEFLQLRSAFGLTERNAPRVASTGFVHAVRLFQRCKKQSETGVLTPEQKTAAQSSDACLSVVQDSIRSRQRGTTANPKPQPAPPTAGAQPNPVNPEPQPTPLSPTTR
jgi:hypothetical protein